jgi:hypothetical protein
MTGPEQIPGFDLYAELGIGRGADAAEIERAWRSKVKTTHPDVAGGVGEATERTARLNIARTWLLDPPRRARYDALRWAGTGPPAPAPSIDPLGAWPTAPGAGTGSSLPGPAVFAALGLCGVITAIAVGIGTNILTIVIFLVGVLFVVFYGLLIVVSLFLPRR